MYMQDMCMDMYILVHILNNCVIYVYTYKTNYIYIYFFFSWCVLRHIQLFVTQWIAACQAVHGIFQERILEWVAISFS